MTRIVTAVQSRPLWWGRLLARIAAASALFMLLGPLAGCAWLDETQRRVALRPTPGQPAGFAGLRAGDERYLVPVPASAPGADGVPQQLALWWLPHPNPQAPTLLYLHGTFRNLYQNLPKIDALREAGFAIVAVDYRGWGDSTVLVPSEASIMADAWQAWAELQRRQPDAGRRVIYGHSMGGSVAVQLASSLRHRSDYGALVLEATFSRLADVAAAAGFWGRIGAWLTTLDFDSASRIGRVDAPLLMIHGSADRTVPASVGRLLLQAAPPGTRWVEVPGGTHSRLQTDAPELYQQTLHELIARLEPSLPATPTRP